MSALLVLLAVAQLASAEPPVKPTPAAQLVPHPPMHWHSWNQFSGEATVTEASMREIGDALVATGMAAAGYDTVNVVCNGWGARDNVTQRFTENKQKWPTGMAGLGTYLHSRGLKMGCYTAPGKHNCCGEPGSEGHEAVDAAFFAEIGCDHIMSDYCQPYQTPAISRANYAKLGKAIRASANPNMLYGIWHTGFGKSWKWFSDAEVGGHYTRVVTDMSNYWEKGAGSSQPGSVLKNFDVAMSIPGIQAHTVPGHYSFLDNMVVGVKPGGHAVAGPGLSTEEARAHFTMWVMAASPLLTNNDVRNMSAAIKGILMNPEVLAVHKDPLARMAARVDVGGGVDEPRSASHLDVSSSVYARPLADGSSAVMVLNRANASASVSVALEDVGSYNVTHYAIRDLWARANISSVPVVKAMGYQEFNLVNTMQLEVPAHGVRLLRMWPLPPTPPACWCKPPLLPCCNATPPAPPAPAPARACPSGFTAHAPGYWHNTDPCPNNTFLNCTEDVANGTVALCAKKCKATGGCVAFEVPGSAQRACYIFLTSLAAPFTPYAGGTLTCTVKP
jgi:alpha-galactosidase